MKNALAIAATLLLAACGTINPTVVTVEPTTIRPAIAPATPATRGGIWSAQARPLFEDTRARAPGDTLTIAINEKLSASQSSKSNIEKTGSTAFSVPVIQGLPGKAFQGASAQADSSNKYDGKGETAADNAFVGTITATVIEVLPNGNLVVSGEKQIGVNRQVEILRFSGIVDPRWIAPGNTVSSTRVADARLEFHGNGQLSEAQRMGWLQRFFLTFLPF